MKDVSKKKMEPFLLNLLDDLRNNTDKFFTYLMEHEKH